VKDFRGKVAVITGGASGVGRSLAFALGRRGAKIAIGDVDGSAMEQVGQDLASENIEAIVEHCDVTSLESLVALADAATEKLGGLDLVFANAGIGAGEAGSMWDYSEKVKEHFFSPKNPSTLAGTHGRADPSEIASRDGAGSQQLPGGVERLGRLAQGQVHAAGTPSGKPRRADGLRDRCPLLDLSGLSRPAGDDQPARRARRRRGSATW